LQLLPQLGSAAEGSDLAAKKLLETVAESPVLGTRSFQVKHRVQNKKIKGNRIKVQRPARRVMLEVRVAKIELAGPWRRRTQLPPVTISVVLAKEIDPPADQEAICWILLTSLEVETLAEASEILEFYLVRWEIEVFHRVLKTGCRVEELQLKEDQRVQPAIALYMIVAWRVLYLLKLGRECPELPCDVAFEREEWQAIVVLVKGRETLTSTPPSLREMVRMVAGFGGFVARKSDGEPGAESMWIGLSRLRDFALCWQSFGPAT
jgi:Transposase Tn5 dimerisation domain